MEVTQNRHDDDPMQTCVAWGTVVCVLSSKKWSVAIVYASGLPAMSTPVIKVGRKPWAPYPGWLNKGCDAQTTKSLAQGTRDKPRPVIGSAPWPDLAAEFVDDHQYPVFPAVKAERVPLSGAIRFRNTENPASRSMPTGLTKRRSSLRSRRGRATTVM
jgi:hypothetical protein